MDICNVNVPSLITLALLMLSVCGQIPEYSKDPKGTMRHNQRWIFSDTYRCGRRYYFGPRHALERGKKYVKQRDLHSIASEEQNPQLNASDEPDLNKLTSSRVTQDAQISDHTVSNKPNSDQTDSNKPISDQKVLNKPISDQPLVGKLVSVQPVLDNPASDRLEVHTNLNDKSDNETDINDMTDRNSYVDDVSVSNEDGEDDEELDKILGARYSGIGETPWQVNIKTKVGYGYPGTFKHRCGGAIIAEFYVLTAAHCIYDKMTNQVKVILGDWDTTSWDGGEQVRDVQFLIPHENYEDGSYHDDIGIIKIKPRVTWGIEFNENVQPLCLPTGVEEPKVGENLIFSGYGQVHPEIKDFSEVLKRSNLPMIDQETCKKLYAPNNITDKMFCAGAFNGDSDACYGDYGGPAVFIHERSYVLYGIASFGDGCAMPNSPIVFTRVLPYIPWIQRAIMHFGDSVSEQTVPRRPP